MLHLYRRHVPDCFFFDKARGAKGAKGCRTACPIWVQGSLRGEYIRRALNLTSWEAASDLVRQWEASGTIGVVKPDVPTVRQAVEKFFADAEARRLSSSTISKQKNVLEKRLVPWCEQQGIRLLKNLTVDAVRQFRETWPDAPITASRNLARLRALLIAVRPGGLLAVGNVAAHNPSRWAMEYFSEWFLNHRTREELRMLVRPLTSNGVQVDVDAEPSGINLFLLLRPAAVVRTGEP